MDASKYNREIPAQCPTCGSTQLCSADEVGDDSAIVTCAGCNRSMTRGDLMEANAESIDLHVREVKEQVTKDVKDEIGKMLRNAFKNNKNITIK
jgi:malate/lactate dehydrogenase